MPGLVLKRKVAYRAKKEEFCDEDEKQSDRDPVYTVVCVCVMCVYACMAVREIKRPY